ncbi:WD40-repeat-containing domain protein [Suillus subaureus]|uniref:WD40-repeat-containing domain protein n=1 Tax=Suillus subaureus TaxID=48587 RepID=A0A9P7E961_9AGAM|nr:WD40-repeat-containing domain protein [Suillus subaureus]KAG1814009.1 WD40-repeat-containing domain protein [Suillus subaureus]
MSYFLDGNQMISGSGNKTARRWNLREGKDIKEAREVCKNRIEVVGVSRDGRRVIAAADNLIECIDVSPDSTLLAGVLVDSVRIWHLDTGELVAGPFECGDDGIRQSALRFSEDCRKLALLSAAGRFLQVWDIQTQNLDVQKSATFNGGPHSTSLTNSNTTTTIYEFDASTLETIGAPFKGHTDIITGLALSSDCTLLASSSCDSTIKLWAFESRQLLASFDVESPLTLLSPDSRQLAYTTFFDSNIHICDIPADILASVGLSEESQPSTSKSKRSHHANLLNSDATHRPMCHKPVITPVMSPIPRPLPTRDPNTFLRFRRKLLPSPSLCFPVDLTVLLQFPATSPLPRPLIQPNENSRPTPVPPTSQFSATNTSATLKSSLHRMSTWLTPQIDHASPAIVDVPLAPGKLRYATVGAPGDDDDLIRDEDYVSPSPSLNPGSRAQMVNAGQHGNGRFCFCF